MLNRFEIIDLYGLYSYDIDFTNDYDSFIKIITGPNGFGKTTVLSLINAFYNNDFYSISSVLFSKLLFNFDNKLLVITQSRIIDEEQESDVSNLKDVVLSCEFFKDSKSQECESFVFYRNGTGTNTHSGSFELIMQSCACTFITDERLVFKTDDEKSSTSRIDNDAIKKVSDSIKSILEKYDGIENTPATEKLRLETFKNIIEKSKFADKDLVIDKFFGLRFKMRNELKEFISPNKLSSGEKHIVVQAYDLLFEARDGMIALVDEPELSFHPAWLNQYLDNIKLIQKLKKIEDKPLQLIIATHSPVLVAQNWDLCIDLYANRKR